MKTMLLSWALLLISIASHASITCKVHNSNIILVFSQGQPFVEKGGMFSSARIVRPLVITKVDKVSGMQSLYSNGCRRNASLWKVDVSKTVINFCLEFVIFKGEGVCQNGHCAAKLNLGWVNNDSFQNDFRDATCTGAL